MTGLDLLSILPYSSGLVLGTAFLASPECLYSPAHKQRVIDAQSAEDTVRTLVFDNARGTTEGFGSMVDGRALRNLMTREEEEGVAEELLNGRYGEALKLGPEKGGIERIVVWAGEDGFPFFWFLWSEWWLIFWVAFVRRNWSRVCQGIGACGGDC